MIILKLPTLNERDLLKVATVLFNMEQGKTIFNTNGTICENLEDFHIVRDNGIVYSIRGRLHNLIILGNTLRKTELKKLIDMIQEQMVILDDKYEESGGIYTEISIRMESVNMVQLMGH